MRACRCLQQRDDALSISLHHRPWRRGLHHDCRPGAFTEQLLKVVESTSTRCALGAAGRSLATIHGNVENYRQRLFERLGELTGMRLPEQWAKAA